MPTLKQADPSTIDWNTTAFPIGLSRPSGQQPWLGLSLTELRILTLILNKPIQLDPNTYAIPTEDHEGLARLASWAKSVVDWKYQQPERTQISRKLSRDD